MSDLFEEIRNTNRGMTIVLRPKDIVRLWVTWDPSWLGYSEPMKVCQATITFQKDNVESKITLGATNLPELFKKIEEFLTSL